MQAQLLLMMQDSEDEQPTAKTQIRVSKSPTAIAAENLLKAQ